MSRFEAPGPESVSGVFAGSRYASGVNRPIRPQKARALWLCIGLSMLIGGCSASRIAGWYTTRKIDKYLDLTSEQKKFVRARVDVHIEGLRRRVSTDVLPLLKRVRYVTAKGATEQEIAKLQDDFDSLFDMFVDRITPDAAAVFAMLDAEQIDRFHRKMREDIDDAYEDIRDRSPEEADEKLIDAVEKWTGSLEDAQIARVLAVTRDLQSERKVAFGAHRRRLDGFVAFLKRKPGAKAVHEELLRLWHTRYEAMAPERSREVQRAEHRRVLLTIDGMLTEKQRKHAVAEIDKRIRKIRRFSLPPDGE